MAARVLTAPTPRLPRGWSMKVLVIDDDRSVRTALKRLLSTHGYEVLTATDGAVGLQLLASFHVDVILLDERMPVMNGKIFRERQLSDPLIADIPVVLISDVPNLNDFTGSMRLEHARKSDSDYLVETVARVCSARAHGRD